MCILFGSRTYNSRAPVLNLKLPVHVVEAFSFEEVEGYPPMEPFAFPERLLNPPKNYIELYTGPEQFKINITVDPLELL